jgi:Na+/H+ antiporter NhaD/arsenite permease-like protein
LILVALISGLINLDVAVVVAMPVALRVAGRTGLPSSGFAIAVAITANAASILLPTSNPRAAARGLCRAPPGEGGLRIGESVTAAAC